MTVHAGQPLKISARDWNDMLAVVNGFKLARADRANVIHGAPDGLVRVQNNSGADRARFEVLGIDVPIFTPTDNLLEYQNRITLKGVSPDATTHAGRFVVLAEPIKSTAVGRAWASCICPVQIAVTDTGHQYADVATADMAKLASGTSGAAHILWKETGTGTKWATVRLGKGGAAAASITLYRVRAQAAAGASVLLSVKQVDSAGDVTGSAFDVKTVSGVNWNKTIPHVQSGEDFFAVQIDSVWLAMPNWENELAITGRMLRADADAAAGDSVTLGVHLILDDGTTYGNSLTAYLPKRTQKWDTMIPRLALHDELLITEIDGKWYGVGFIYVGKC